MEKISPDSMELEYTKNGSEISITTNSETVNVEYLDRDTHIETLVFKKSPEYRRKKVNLKGNLLETFPNVTALRMDRVFNIEKLEIPLDIEIISKYVTGQSMYDEIVMDKNVYVEIVQIESDLLSQVKALCRLEDVVWQDQISIRRFSLDNNNRPYIDTLAISNEIPAGIFGLSHLDRLRKLMVHTEEGYFEGHNPDSGFYSVGQLKSLEVFELDSPYQEKLPAWVTEMDQIKVLDVENISIHELPEDIGRMTGLEEIDASYNFLTTIPRSIGELRNLRKLQLNNNRLESLPDSIGKLQNLRLLYLGDTNLQSLPDSLGNLVNLISLGMGIDQVSTFPTSMRNLNNLQQLAITGKNLKQFPSFVRNLASIKEITISDTQIRYIPNWIEELSDLKLLCISNNELTSIPQEIENLTNLKELYLGNNPLTSLPKGLKNLPNLIRIDLCLAQKELMKEFEDELLEIVTYENL